MAEDRIDQIKDGAFVSSDAPAPETTSADRTRAARVSRTFRNKRGAIRINGENEKKMSPFKQATAELMNSKTQNIPVEVRMTGIEPMRPRAGADPVMTPVCHYKGWKIYIPREEFFLPYTLTPEERSDDNVLNIKLYRCQGSYIDIIPEVFITEQKIIVASRVKAMEVKKNEYWFAKNVVGRKGHTQAQDFIHVGSRVEARIVQVARTMLTVEIFGVEASIPVDEVSYLRVGDLRTKYECGDTTFVVITKLNKSEETGDVKFEASIKQAYPNPKIAGFMKYHRGGVYEGRVSMIKTDPEKGEKSGAFVTLGEDDGSGDDCEIDILCKYPRGGILPLIGDKVRVRVTWKDEEGFKLFGTIQHVYKN